MQSDRLLSLLFLLQARGRVTARELARELEVSKRTIYRDIESLSAAGVPVYAERGRNGGCALLPGYTTDVTGLTAVEARALFVFAGGGVAGDLGLEPDLRSALRKLMAAVPAPHRPDAVRAQERVIVDPQGWMRGHEDLPALAPIQEAIWTDRRLRIRYRSADAASSREVDVDPYGLVAKAGVWYLVAGADGAARLYRVSRVEAATILAEPAVRPPGLDLQATWTELRQRFEERGGSGFETTVRVPRPVLPLFLRMCAGRTIAAPVEEPPGDAAREGDTDATVRLVFSAEGAAAATLLSFAGDVEVLAPDTLRARLGAAGRALVERYAAGSSRRAAG